jgi:hypothetical protein
VQQHAHRADRAKEDKTHGNPAPGELVGYQIEILETYIQV